MTAKNDRLKVSFLSTLAIAALATACVTAPEEQTVEEPIIISESQLTEQEKAQIASTTQTTTEQTTTEVTSIQPGANAESSESSTEIVETVEVTPIVKTNLKYAGFKFATGATRLTFTDKELLADIAAILRKHNNDWAAISIEGHADLRGKYKYNVRLSQSRARSVRRVLLGEGIPTARILTSGYGFDRPLLDDVSRRSLQRNRRVELKIIGATDNGELEKDIRSLLKEYRAQKINL